MKLKRVLLMLLAGTVASIQLHAADTLTRPDESGHPLPQGEGKEHFAAAPISEQQAGWQSAVIEKIDSSIQRIQGESVDRGSPMAGSSHTDSSTLEVPASPAIDKTDPKEVIAALLRQQGLPPGLTSVVTVESAFNPFAISPKGARGLWQLMPDTGRRYGLTVTPDFDERIDPVRSTQAAASYLKDLFVKFGDWPLALASYNAGEDRVSRAMLKTGAQDFWTLQRRRALPEETLQYVPAVLQRLEGPLNPPDVTDRDSNAESQQSLQPTGRVLYATSH